MNVATVATVAPYTPGPSAPTPTVTPELQATVDAVAHEAEQNFRTHFGWNGWDNKGAPVTVEFMDGTRGLIVSGDHGIESDMGVNREGTVAGTLAADRDFVAHELGHSVMSRNGFESGRNHKIGPHLNRWTSYPERGMVHESFADVLSETFDDNWIIGDRSVGPNSRFARDLQHPKYPNMAAIKAAGFVEAHDASITLSHAAAIVGDALGREAMGQLWFHAITDHLDPRSGPRAAAQAVQRAADDRYGAGSHESQAVHDAWHAVGLLTHPGA